MLPSTSKQYLGVPENPLKLREKNLNKHEPAPCSDENYIQSLPATATHPHTHKTSHPLSQTHTQLTWTCPQLVAETSRLGRCLQVQQGPEGKQAASGRTHTCPIDQEK